MQTCQPGLMFTCDVIFVVVVGVGPAQPNQAVVNGCTMKAQLQVTGELSHFSPSLV